MTHPTSRPVASILTTVQVPTTVGLDISDRDSHFHVMRGDGVTLSTGKVATVASELTQRFDEWAGCRLVIEAGCHSPWISRLGLARGLEVVVANPRRVELIAKSDKKTDRTDAETLARLGKSNIEVLAPITHRSKQAQEHLAVLRARNAAVSARTMLINQVRGTLKSHGHRAPKCAAQCFASRVKETIAAELAPALLPIVELIAHTDQAIRGYDKKLEGIAEEHYPVTEQLRAIRGVGPIVSLALVLTLDDPKRYKARDVGAYLGLVPRMQCSGKMQPQLGITKAGDREMRRLLVISANYILGRHGPDCDLRRFGLRLAGDGGDKNAKKRAKVAVARKLAILMHHLWRTGAVYDPLFLAKKKGDAVPA